jgi:hypothetical protein
VGQTWEWNRKCCNQKSPWRSRTPNEDEKPIRQASVRNQRKSISIASRKQHLPTSQFMTRSKNVFVRTNCRCGSTSSQPTVTTERWLCKEMLQKIDWRVRYSRTLLCISDEAAFYLICVVSRRNCRICGNQLPQEINEHQKDTSDVTVPFGIDTNFIITVSLFVCFFFRRNHDTPFVLVLVTTLHSATIALWCDGGPLTFWKQYPPDSIWTLSEGVDWKRRPPSMVPKIIRFNIIGSPWLYLKNM